MSINAWDEVDWNLVESRVSRLQTRIYLASSNNEIGKVHFLQKKLLISTDAKYLAVRCITQINRGKRSAGIDRQRNLTNEQRHRLAQTLRITGTASPIRKKMIVKPGKSEFQHLGIPTIHDRALQQLVRFVLEPEWEAKFEPNSYGFRPGRSCHDAIGAIFSTNHGRDLYVLNADIRKCFDTINHKKLLDKLDTFPKIRTQIQAWLQAGIMECYSNCPKEEDRAAPNTIGTPQGGIISPLLVNIALHGLETDTKTYYVNNLYNESKPVAIPDQKRQVSVIRYADDFVVLHKDETTVHALKAFISRWLQENAGLKLSDEKTVVKTTKEGFHFLGFHIISVPKGENKTKCKIHISRKSKNKLLKKTSVIFQNNRSASKEALILLLNPVIVRWCNYFRYVECTYDFKQVEYSLYGQLRKWVYRRKSKGIKSKKRLKKNYFPQNTKVMFRGTQHTGNWILVGHIHKREQKSNAQSMNQIFLVYPSWIKSDFWTNIQGDKSPYNGDNLYWAKRNPKYCKWNPHIIKLVRYQDYKCPVCEQMFTEKSSIEIDHTKPMALEGKDVLNKIQAVHDYCHSRKTRAASQLIKAKTLMNPKIKTRPKDLRKERTDT